MALPTPQPLRRGIRLLTLARDLAARHPHFSTGPPPVSQAPGSALPALSMHHWQVIVPPMPLGTPPLLGSQNLQQLSIARRSKSKLANVRCGTRRPAGTRPPPTPGFAPYSSSGGIFCSCPKVSSGVPARFPHTPTSAARPEPQISFRFQLTAPYPCSYPAPLRECVN